MFGVIDQGTTSSRFIIFDENQNIISQSQKEHKQITPKPGWVEHDPIEIWNNVYQLILETVKKTKLKLSDLKSIGITNQRETFVIWDNLGNPLYNAIVWQDLRTSSYCDQLSKEYGSEFFADLTGLRLSPYFSASKINWLLNKISNKDIKIGTIDSWLLYKLTNQHIIDITNASRTLLFDINSCSWSPKLCEIFNVDINTLPKILPSISSRYPDAVIDGVSIPIRAVMGDQQAALFGHSCLTFGEMKVTYGTGAFLLVNTENKKIKEDNLLTIISYQEEGRSVQYGLEGSVAIAGSLLQWLRDDLRLFSHVQEIDDLAESVQDTAGCYLVPAFSGLFAPYWRADARGCIVGLTRAVKKQHIARAALEAIAFQVDDLVETFNKALNIKINSINADGGLTNSIPLMKFQSDLSCIEIKISNTAEVTALGVALASMKSFGISINKNKIKLKYNSINTDLRNAKINWKKAIEKSLNWENS